MNESTDRKQRSHERIVDAAARAIRQRGYAGVGVADVMKEAGLTHGGFYAHFPSRDALIVAALERAAQGLEPAAPAKAVEEGALALARLAAGPATAIRRSARPETA